MEQQTFVKLFLAWKKFLAIVMYIAKCLNSNSLATNGEAWELKSEKTQECRLTKKAGDERNSGITWHEFSLCHLRYSDWIINFLPFYRRKGKISFNYSRSEEWSWRWWKVFENMQKTWDKSKKFNKGNKF